MSRDNKLLFPRLFGRKTTDQKQHQNSRWKIRMSEGKQTCSTWQKRRRMKDHSNCSCGFYFPTAADPFRKEEHFDFSNLLFLLHGQLQDFIHFCAESWTCIPSHWTSVNFLSFTSAPLLCAHAVGACLKPAVLFFIPYRNKWKTWMEEIKIRSALNIFFTPARN